MHFKTGREFMREWLLEAAAAAAAASQNGQDLHAGELHEEVVAIM